MALGPKVSYLVTESTFVEEAYTVNLVAATLLHHHRLLRGKTFSECLVGQNETTVEIQLISNNHILADHRDALDSHPLSNVGSPADYGLDDPGVRLDDAAFQDSAIL